MVSYKNLVKDPKRRIEKELQPPLATHDRIAFWMAIYSQFPSEIRVVHDRHNLNLIYGYINLFPIYKLYGKTVQADAQAYFIENKIIRDLKNKILEASLNQNTKLLSLEEKSKIQKFLSTYGKSSKQEGLTLVQNIRTQTGQKDEFIKATNRAKNLLPHMESEFKKQGIPIGLTRIPYVESSFNHRAFSKDEAMGIWQFMPETAEEWMKTEDIKILADPLKQTKVAAKLLKLWRSVLPDWSITITAYNSGIGTLRSLSRKYGAKNIDVVLQDTHNNQLGFAGENFYAEVMAANFVLAYQKELFNTEKQSLLLFENSQIRHGSSD
jgi:membrane-bound lytic murein transglycosylase D